MATGNGSFAQILKDLELSPPEGMKIMDWMNDNPKEFIKRAIDKANELGSYLDKKNTLTTMEEDFKSSALKNKEARKEANAILDKINDLLTGLEIDVLINVLDGLHEVTDVAKAQIRFLSARESGSRYLPKKMVHQQYMKFKAGYDLWIKWMLLSKPGKKAGTIEGVGIPPVIPAKSGNYSEPTTSGMKLFRIIINGDTFDNPYSAARHLGVEITHFMDIIDIVRKYNGQIGENEVEIEEY